MGRAELASLPCVMGGTHDLTSPQLWVGASSRKCHRTWEGPDHVPTWADLPEALRKTS